jgi:hypothetical protein
MRSSQRLNAAEVMTSSVVTAFRQPDVKARRQSTGSLVAPTKGPAT